MDPTEFLARVEAALSSSGMTATAFGKLVAGDPTFVFELRDGRECRSSTVKKVIAAIERLEAERAAA